MRAISSLALLGAVVRLAADDGKIGEALQRRCELRIEAGDSEGGLADCGLAINKNPKSALPYVFRGVQLWKVGRFEMAFADFDRALSIDPENCAAMAYRGAIELNQGNPKQAREDLDSAVRCDPQNRLALHSRGVTRIHFSDFHGAIRDLTSAIDLDPTDPVAFERRAVAFGALGNKARAEADLAQARKLRHAPVDQKGAERK